MTVATDTVFTFIAAYPFPFFFPQKLRNSVWSKICVSSWFEKLLVCCDLFYDCLLLFPEKKGRQEACLLSTLSRKYLHLSSKVCFLILTKLMLDLLFLFSFYVFLSFSPLIM